MNLPMTLSGIPGSLLLTRPGDWAPLPLRVSLGLVFLAHGGQKLFAWFDGPGLAGTGQAFDSMGMAPGWLWGALAAGGEFFGGLLVLLGLLTRPAALNLAVIMAVAMVAVHWGTFFLPEGIEYTLVLLGMSLSLVCSGGGAASADAWLVREKTGEKGR